MGDRITGRGLQLGKREGGQYRKTRENERQITPRLFDEALRNNYIYIIYIYIYLNLYDIYIYMRHTQYVYVYRP